MYRPSYCHPWASGVTPWLSTKLGGINPLRRGYKQFVILPYVSLNYPSVMTQVNTPYGYISVTAELTLLSTTTPTSNSSNNSSNMNVNNIKNGDDNVNDDDERDDSNRRTKTPPLLLFPSSTSALYQFNATVKAPVSGLFGIRRKVLLKYFSSVAASSSSSSSSSNSSIGSLSSSIENHEEAWLDMDSIIVDGISIIAATDDDDDTIATIADTLIVVPRIANRMLRHIGSNNQKSNEYLFVRLNPRNTTTTTTTASSHVITATYSHRWDDESSTKIDNDSDDTSSLFDSSNIKQFDNSIPNQQLIQHHHHNRNHHDHNHNLHYYLGLDDTSPFPIPTYRGTVIQPVDRVSQGDGLFLYGKDGYMLLGFNKNDEEINNSSNCVEQQKLPSYISQIKIRRHGELH